MSNIVQYLCDGKHWSMRNAGQVAWPTFAARTQNLEKSDAVDLFLFERQNQFSLETICRILSHETRKRQTRTMIENKIKITAHQFRNSQWTQNNAGRIFLLATRFTNVPEQDRQREKERERERKGEGEWERERSKAVLMEMWERRKCVQRRYCL